MHSSLNAARFPCLHTVCRAGHGLQWSLWMDGRWPDLLVYSVRLIVHLGHVLLLVSTSSRFCGLLCARSAVGTPHQAAGCGLLCYSSMPAPEYGGGARAEWHAAVLHLCCGGSLRWCKWMACAGSQGPCGVVRASCRTPPLCCWHLHRSRGGYIATSFGLS